MESTNKDIYLINIRALKLSSFENTLCQDLHVNNLKHFEPIRKGKAFSQESEWYNIGHLFFIEWKVEV